MRTITVLAALAAVSGTMLIAGTTMAKGPFRAEISGGVLASPIKIEGPLSVETVFLNDAVEAAPPKTLRPAYTVKLMPEQPDGETGEYPVLMTLTYFPGDGDGPALLRVDWGSRMRAAASRYLSLEPVHLAPEVADARRVAASAWAGGRGLRRIRYCV